MLHFIAHICKTTDVPNVPAAAATGIKGDGDGGGSGGGGGNGEGGGETKEAAPTNANAAKATHQATHHHQTGGFSQFDNESEEEGLSSDTTCFDEDDDTDNDSEDSDDGTRQISHISGRNVRRVDVRVDVKGDVKGSRSPRSRTRSPTRSLVSEVSGLGNADRDDNGSILVSGMLLHISVYIQSMFSVKSSLN